MQKRYLTALLLLLVCILPLSCDLNPGMNQVVITNSIITGIHTNWTTLSNDVTIYSNGFVITGSINLSNHFNEERLQPTFLLSGTLSGDIVDYIPDGTNSLRVYITNNGYSNYGKIIDQGTYKSWSVVVYQQTDYYLFSLLHFQAPGYSDIFLGMNFYISNIPASSYARSYDQYLTNASSMDVSGWAYLTDPDRISSVTLWSIDENHVTNSQSAALTPGTAWTNTVYATNWSANLPLSYGENLVWAQVQGDNGLSTTMDRVTIIRSLMGIDGIRESLWDSAPLLGSSSTPKANGTLLGEMRMTNDGANLYIWVDALNVPDLGPNGARISLSIDTNTAAGTDHDAWSSWDGRFTLMPTNNNQPDFQIQFRIQEGGGQALYSAGPTNTWVTEAYNWNNGDMKKIKMAVIRTNGFEMSIPLSVLNITASDTLHTLCVLSGNADDDGVWDVIPQSLSNDVKTNGSNLSNYIERVYNKPYGVR